MTITTLLISRLAHLTVKPHLFDSAEGLLVAARKVFFRASAATNRTRITCAPLAQAHLTWGALRRGVFHHERALCTASPDPEPTSRYKIDVDNGRPVHCRN